MIKILALVIVATMVVSMSGCSKNEANITDQSVNNTSATEVVNEIEDSIVEDSNESTSSTETSTTESSTETSTIESTTKKTETTTVESTTKTKETTTAKPTTTQKETTTKKETTTQATTKETTTKKETTTQKPTTTTTTKPATTTTTTTQKNVTPKEVQDQVNAYIKSKGFIFDSSLTPDTASWNGRISRLPQWLNDGSTLRECKAEVDFVLTERDPSRTAAYCYYDEDFIYILFI